VCDFPLTDTYLTRILFQRIELPTFGYFDSTFQLLNSAAEDDLYIYKIAKDNFSMNVFVFGICLHSLWAPIVDFFYFVCQNYERISSKQ